MEVSTLGLDARMMKSAPRRWVVAGFVALAVLAGPVMSFVMSATGLGGQYLGPVGTAVASGVAGAALLVVALARKERMPRGSAWIALLTLFVPQWLAGLLTAPAIRAVPWLHETPWGMAFLVALAAPLWLGLLSALQMVREEMPRAVAGASIAGIGAVCLVIPVTAYAVGLDQIPVALMQVLLGVVTVFSWAFAKPRLAEAGTAAIAGCFLLLTAAGEVAVLPLVRSDLPAALDWREALLPMAAVALLNAASWWLWFWLLERMTLAAFCMRTLAMWVASAAPGIFLYGLAASWRMDAAIPIAIAALVVALRARVSDEQPLALGLEQP